jgi:hypothetical protein
MLLYSKKEVSLLLFSALSFAVIFFINRWRNTSFTYTTGITYFIFLFIIAALILFTAVSVQKKYAYSLGYLAEFHSSFWFIVTGMVISFLSLGYALLLFPGFVILSPHPLQRIGHYRPAIHDKDIGLVSLFFAISCFGLAILFLILNGITHADILKEIPRMAFPLALISLIPAPKNLGIAIYKWSRVILVTAMIIIIIPFIGFFMTDPALIIGTVIGSALLFAITILELLPHVIYGT